MDAAGIFTCPVGFFFGHGEQLAGTHGWQNGASRWRVVWQAACPGEELREARRCGWMDGQTDNALSQRSFVAMPAGCKDRDET